MTRAPTFPRPARTLQRWLPLLLLPLATAGCLSAPDVVLLDRATVLEEQAAGSFHALEVRLARAGMNPTPVPLTPNQLEDLGMQVSPLVENLDQTPAERVDDLLQRHCIGEGNDGLLVETRRQCTAGRLTASDSELVQRVNRSRLQLWAWMQSQRPRQDAATLRRQWQRVHHEGLACGAWRQADDGNWEEKKC